MASAWARAFFGGLMPGLFSGVGVDEKLGDFLFFCCEGVEVGNALKLFGGAGFVGAGRFR